MNIRDNFLFPAAVIALLSTPVSALADVLLTIVGNDGAVVAELTEEDLLAYEQTQVVTENDFVDGAVTFSGPLARDVVGLFGDAVPETVYLSAINDYTIEVPVSDFFDYDVIMALTANGEKFSRRDKGPIWLIYPQSEHSELQDRIYNDRLIWQLVRMEAR